MRGWAHFNQSFTKANRYGALDLFNILGYYGVEPSKAKVTVGESDTIASRIVVERNYR